MILKVLTPKDLNMYLLSGIIEQKSWKMSGTSRTCDLHHIHTNKFIRVTMFVYKDKGIKYV